MGFLSVLFFQDEGHLLNLFVCHVIPKGSSLLFSLLATHQLLPPTLLILNSNTILGGKSIVGLDSARDEGQGWRLCCQSLSCFPQNMLEKKSKGMSGYFHFLRILNLSSLRLSQVPPQLLAWYSYFQQYSTSGSCPRTKNLWNPFQRSWYVISNSLVWLLQLFMKSPKGWIAAWEKGPSALDRPPDSET